MLAIDVSQNGAGTLLSLSGRLTIDSSPELRARLLAILHQEPPPTLIVDMKNITYIDSSGLVTLIEALKLARIHRTTLTVKGLQGRIIHVLRTIGLLDLFDTNGTTTALADSKVQ